ncbi:MarR family winged helix-turn-helix transcriptional regulator [Pseudonocardia charpentierae]|uniref:MarR family transcriptional regulator n=1 Tax=Pseudonocardia charpentierae TaxID=3075545 RepID=A0ABU2NEN9_9PSEU|nr:MarR family transcriptional regulator [Pseudonocardia sp. DSM 45834]MDT0352428.1 MarR family transcriptional regulator [Pseudonocardia sp. DSM 45834]
MAQIVRGPQAEWADDVEATMLAARALVAISAESVAAVEEVVTPTQLRVLVMVASRGPLNLGAVARGLGVHPSNATRACDRLVLAGLLDRQDDPTDRRNLQLRLTEQGRGVVDEVMDRRRRAIGEVLERMPSLQRVALIPVLTMFAEAAGELPDEHLWSLGWTSATTNVPAADDSIVQAAREA